MSKVSQDEIDNWIGKFYIKVGRVPTKEELKKGVEYLNTCKKAWDDWINNKVDVEFDGKDFVIVQKNGK